MKRWLVIFSIVLIGCPCDGDKCPAQEPPSYMQLPDGQRAWFRNPDGSCVQCSIGMVGVHCNDMNATALLWDTAYGKAQRGGSGPSRVQNYCSARGIEAYNVTGDTTILWLRWAARTGRFAAMGAGGNHFQTMYGRDPTDRERPWLVCNNNSTHRIDRYSEDSFKKLHYASGPWVVVLKNAVPDVPEIIKWWEK